MRASHMLLARAPVLKALVAVVLMMMMMMMMMIA
jgi:hypothetical protein